MNVLLVSFSFPPAGGVGVLRALSLAKYLPEDDIRVDVLTARNAPAVGRDMALLDQVPASVTVHRTWTLDLPFAVRKGIKKVLSHGASSGDGMASKSSGSEKNVSSEDMIGSKAVPPNPGAAPGRSPMAIFKSFVANLLLPDPQIGWLPFAFPAAKRIIRSRKIDAVVITVPPFSSVMLVKKLRRHFPKLPIVLDFRDEWLTTTIKLVSLNDNARARRIAEATEREAVKAATSVVMVTEPAQHELRNRYPDQPAIKFHCISNGFDGPLPVFESEGFNTSLRFPLVLTYMGSVYGSTDPTTLVEAVLRLPADLRKAIHIRFVGHIETAAHRENLLRAGDTVELVGFLPQAEAVRLLQESDLVLLISHDPINVSAKFYDYLGAGKPILGLVHAEGNVRSRLEETRAGWWADVKDIPAIERLLADAVRRAKSGNLGIRPDQEAIARYHRKPLTHRYAELLRDVVVEASRA